MNEQQARELAAHIQSQCPLHEVRVVEDAKYVRWIISVCKPGAEQMLLIESGFEWSQALLAWDVLRD